MYEQTEIDFKCLFWCCSNHEYKSRSKRSNHHLPVSRKESRKLKTKSPTKIQKDDINGAKEITIMHHFLVFEYVTIFKSYFPTERTNKILL